MKIIKISSLIVILLTVSVSAIYYYKNNKKIVMKKTDNNNDVLFFLNNQSAITEKQFKEYVATVIKANPEVVKLLKTVPHFKQILFSGLVQQELLKTWVKKTDVNKRDCYQQEQKKLYNLVDCQLAEKYFFDYVKTSINVSTQEVKEYYKAHKDHMKEAIKKESGVQVKAIVCADYLQAEALLKNKNFENSIEIAKQKKIPVFEFERITQSDNTVCQEVKDAVLQVTLFPEKMIIPAANKFWLCCVVKHKPAVYYDFNQIEAIIKEKIKNEAIKIKFGQKIEALKTVFNAQENKQRLNDCTVV